MKRVTCQKFASYVFCSIYLFSITSCFNYTIRADAKAELEAIKTKIALHQVDAKFCENIIAIATDDSNYNHKKSPALLYQAGKCLEDGTIKNLPKGVTALSLYKASAACNDYSAKEALLRIGIKPPEVKCIENEKRVIFSEFCIDQCGFKQDLTPTGMIVGSPILIGGGVIILAGIIVAVPLCVITAPFLKNKCI